MPDMPVQPQVADPATSTQAVVQQYDPLNPPHAVGKSGLGAKESSAVQTGLDAIVQEVPGAQVVEIEKSPEVPPEVESWIQKVEHQGFETPEQVVVADQTATQPTGNYVSDPVIVLPATQSTIKKGMTKGVKESVRWLAEWCLKVIKKFHGVVVYRQPAGESVGEHKTT